MGKLFPKLYDLAMKPLERHSFKEIRTDLLRRSYGNVLEIGSGSGINFPIYVNVESVTAIEPNQFMIEESLKNKSKAIVPIEIHKSGAEQLPFDDQSYDTVVATLVLCTIPDVEKALLEMKRICKPGGKILLFEHVKMNQPFLAKLQDFLTPAWSKICDGCCLNRETVNVVTAHGFDIVEIKQYYRGLFVMMEIKHH